MSKQGYEEISSVSPVQGFPLPTVGPTIFDKESGSIRYLDKKNEETTIKEKYIGPILRDLRGNKEASAVYANLFEQSTLLGHDSMENLSAFEASLEGKKTTVLLDYWLLRLAGRIHGMSNNDEAKDLTTLYDELSDKLGKYEIKMGELNSHPSAHQNEEREKLVTAMQTEWRQLLQPALEKYKNKWDTWNIFLNLAACATVFGLIGLFCKNLYRLTQGKGLQLFQYEHAHSIKTDKLQKLYDEVETATENDVTKRTNYFTENVEDSYITNAKLQMLVARLENELLTDQKRPEEEQKIDSDNYGTLEGMIHAFKGVIAKVTTDLNRLKDKKDIAKLTDINKSFMGAWTRNVTAQELYENLDTYPEEITDLFHQMIEFSENFEKELLSLNQEKKKPDDAASSVSNFSIGSGSDK